MPDEKEEEWKKLYEKWGVEKEEKQTPSKKHLIFLLSLIVIIGIGYLWATDFFSPKFTSNFVLVEDLPTFNSSDYSIKFDKVPNGFSCDVYLSGQGKILFLSTYLCSELKEKSFRVLELIKNFDRKPGNYILLVKSDLNESYEIEFRVLP